jgi:hypothetical protein
VTHQTGRTILEETSWSPLSFDFSGSQLQGFHLEVPVFDGDITFEGATFAGKNLISAPTFNTSVDFSDTTIAGELDLTRVALQSNLVANRLNVPKDGRLLIAQSFVTSSFGQILVADPVVEGHFDLSVHPDADLRVYINGMDARTNSVVAIRAHSSADTPPGWFHAEGWIVNGRAKIWLPERVAELNLPWLQNNFANSAFVAFGDPPW